MYSGEAAAHVRAMERITLELRRLEEEKARLLDQRDGAVDAGYQRGWKEGVVEGQSVSKAEYMRLKDRLREIEVES